MSHVITLWLYWPIRTMGSSVYVIFRSQLRDPAREGTEGSMANALTGRKQPVAGGEVEELEATIEPVLHASIYEDLRRRMITGKIVPGVGLSTRGLAVELGVSQMPVRDAL